MIDSLRLICPHCRAGLGARSGLGDRCGACGWGVRRLYDVPILREVDDESSLDLTGEAADLPPQHAREANVPFVDEALDSGRLVLELGAGIEGCEDPNLVKTDAFVYGEHLDFVVDAHALPFEENTFDYVFSLSVFEHLHSPWIAAREIFRVLKPGGRAYTLTAFIQHLHGWPEHYFNMTIFGARRIFEPFCDVEVAPNPNTSFEQLSVILADLNAMFLNAIAQEKQRRARKELETVRRASQTVIDKLHDQSDRLTRLSENRGWWERIAPAIEITARKPGP